MVTDAAEEAWIELARTQLLRVMFTYAKLNDMTVTITIREDGTLTVGAKKMINGKLYGDYLKLQDGQGLPFAQCAGQTVSRYTYRVTNYPGYDGPVQINLWVCGGTLAGGDLIAPGKDGFTAGISFPR